MIHTHKIRENTDYKVLRVLREQVTSFMILLRIDLLISSMNKNNFIPNHSFIIKLLYKIESLKNKFLKNCCI